MKEKTNMFIWRFNNQFGNILQKVRSYFSNEHLLEAGTLPRIVQKIAIFSFQIGSGRLLEHGPLIEILRYMQDKFHTQLG